MRTLLALAALLILSLPARAQEVNLRNANLVVREHDVRVQKPGVPLELERNYNSRSNNVGYFGYGWSTNLDIVCEEGPDGSILVTDADGYILRYTPNGEPRERIMERYVDRLVQARREQDSSLGQSRGDSFYRDLRDELMHNPEKRQYMGQVLASAWLDAAPGEYISYDRGTERLEKKTDGSYVRYRADGTQYHFSPEGLLVRLLDTGGRGIRLDYDRDRRLEKITHSEGGSVTLSYSGKQVSQILDTEGRRIAFSYDSTGNLMGVTGPGSRKLAYGYDGEHNLTGAVLADGSSFRMSYDAQRDWIKAVEVDGQVTQYSWSVDANNPERYTCTVTDPGGSITRHHFDDENNRKVVEYADGTTSDTILSACCAKPLEVRDHEGVTRYAYHPKWSRVVQAMHSDGRRYNYTYDKVGNLVEAQDASGRKLTLTYGDNGKVEEIRDQNGAIYTFIYDPSGRPTQIAKGKSGSLNIKYGINGEIRSTEVVQGTSTQSDLYSDLREVLAMLEPATGNLQ